MPRFPAWDSSVAGTHYAITHYPDRNTALELRESIQESAAHSSPAPDICSYPHKLTDHDISRPNRSTCFVARWIGSSYSVKSLLLLSKAYLRNIALCKQADSALLSELDSDENRSDSSHANRHCFWFLILSLIPQWIHLQIKPTS